MMDSTCVRLSAGLLPYHPMSAKVVLVEGGSGWGDLGERELENCGARAHVFGYIASKVGGHSDKIIIRVRDLTRGWLMVDEVRVSCCSWL